MPKTKLNVSMPIIGLSSGKPGEFIDKRATPNCENVEFSRFTIAKRTGFTLVGTTANERIWRTGQLKRGASNFVFRIGNTKFEEFTSSAWTSRANAALTGTDDDPVSVTFPLLTAEKILVYTNGIDAIRKWTGSGNDAALGGSPPLSKHVLAVGPYLILLNVIDGGNNHYSRVQWSDTGDIEEWATGNAGATDLIDDDQEINGGALFADGFTIHKNGCIYVGYLVSTSEVFRFDRRNTGVGAVAGATIQNLPDGNQIFLAKDGIHIFNGVTAPLIDADIMDEIRSGANPEHIHKACSKLFREKDEYWVALPIGSQTEPETIYKYNWRTGQVHKNVIDSLSCLGEFEATTQVTIDDVSTPIDSYPARFDDVINLNLAPTALVGFSDGRVCKAQGVYEDDGEAIDAFWVSKDFTAADFGIDDQGVLVRWQGMEIWAKGTSAFVYYSTNEGQSWVGIKDVTLSGEYPEDDAPAIVYFDKVTSKIRFRFRNNDLDGSFTLKQFMPFGTIRETRR